MALGFEDVDGVAILTLNRPEAMNAIDPETIVELGDAMNRVAADPAIRAVVLTGAGERAFCTGADLKKMMPPPESVAELTYGRPRDGGILATFQIDKPILCAINGYALGGGLELALICDLRIASETARFALSEVTRGSIPGLGGTQRLPRTVGITNAMRMLLTGDHIDAQEAMRIGLVSSIHPAEQLLEEAVAISRRIAANGPLAVTAVKRLAYQGLDLPLPAALELESQAFGLLRDTEDRLEGRRAFQEKRPPRYVGR